MQKTRTDDETGTHQDHRHPHSNKSTGFNIHHSVTNVAAGGGGSGGDQSLVELTPDINNDSVAPPSVEPGGGAGNEGPDKLISPASGPGTRSSSRSSWSAVRPLSHALNLLASSSKAANHQGRFERTKSTAAYALKGLKFTGGDGWPAVESRFNALTASTNGLLLRSHFGECIGMKNSEQFAGELFDALARRREIAGDSINRDQLKEFWDRISDQRFDSRLETFVDMIDKDADGRITVEEMSEIISLSASANKLSSIQKNADVYAEFFREKLDPENNGYIKIETLKRHIWQASKNARQDSISQRPKPTDESSPLRRWYRNTKYFLQDNWQRVWLVAAWTGAMLGLFAWKFVQYRNRAAYDVMGHCVCMAKGAGETLKFNMALILLPVCRNTITWLRNKTKLGVAVPFDDNIIFHQMIAVAVAIGVAIHSIFHLACDFPRLLDASPNKYVPMVRYFGPQPSSYWHFVKSFEGVSGIIMVVLMSIAFTLASPWLRQKSVNQIEPTKKSTGFNAFWSSQLIKKLIGFNAFWYSHHLFVIVYSLLIAHGVKLYLTHKWYNKTTYMYLAVPITIYACERLIRVFRSNITPVKILMVGDYGDVLALHMTKPKGFSYNSGQYVFVKCTAVSPFEWHPFSITSAPGDDYLSVHIRAAGDWTKQIKKMFFEGCDSTHTGKSRLIRADSLTRKNNSIFEKVSIDGPYGAPAQEYKNYEVVLLVGSGIGATPMISIVKDIVKNTRAMEEEENALENGTGGNKLSEKSSSKSAKRKSSINFKTKRAYFYWVTREQRSFSWFKEIMKEVSEMDDKGVIEMHNHCTSIFKEGDARSAVITLLQTLNHDKNAEDIVAGTPVKCHFGRPDWEEVYQNIANKHPHTQVGVFYCGHPGLVGELKSRALNFSHSTNTNSKTKFEFHKENF